MINKKKLTRKALARHLRGYQRGRSMSLQRILQGLEAMLKLGLIEKRSDGVLYSERIVEEAIESKLKEQAARMAYHRSGDQDGNQLGSQGGDVEVEEEEEEESWSPPGIEGTKEFVGRKKGEGQ